jgi:2,3,4,5-tetrahydropyridine-2-carboxylate N-succinyltransferase
MTPDTLQPIIDAAWENRDTIGPDTRGETRQAVDSALAALDAGELRIAEKRGGEWTVHQWLKRPCSCPSGSIRWR